MYNLKANIYKNMFSSIKFIATALTIICYSSMVIAEDIYKGLPENPYVSDDYLYKDIPINPYDLDLHKQLWNESLVTDAESWVREQYNNKFYWDKEDDLDPLFGLDLLLD